MRKQRFREVTEQGYTGHEWWHWSSSSGSSELHCETRTILSERANSLLSTGRKGCDQGSWLAAPSPPLYFGEGSVCGPQPHSFLSAQEAIAQQPGDQGDYSAHCLHDPGGKT